MIQPAPPSGSPALSRRRALLGLAATGVAAGLPAPRRAARPGGDAPLVVAPVRPRPARGLRGPDRQLRGGQPRHQGRVRAHLRRGLPRPARRRLRLRAGPATWSPTCRPSRCSPTTADGPGRAVRRRDRGHRPGQNYYPGANDVFEIDDGHFAGTGIGNTRRQHAVARRRPDGKAARRRRPRDLGRAARRLPEDADRRHLRRPPALRPELDDLADLHRLHPPRRRPGFTPDLQVAIDSARWQCAGVLRGPCASSARPGATNYSWGESLTAFVSGRHRHRHLRRPRAGQRQRAEPGHADQSPAAPTPRSPGRASPGPSTTSQGLHPQGRQQPQRRPRIRRLPVPARRLHPPAPRGSRPRAAGAPDDRPGHPATRRTPSSKKYSAEVEPHGGGGRRRPQPRARERRLNPATSARTS